MAAYSVPAVQELDTVLQSLQSLKPPGVNKTKVETATKICMDPQNVPVSDHYRHRNQLVLMPHQIEPYLVDSLISAFNKSPDSHKLGVLYIIDSIMRQWVLTGVAHAGGVRKVTDNMPAMINPYLLNVPDGQKVSCIEV